MVTVRCHTFYFIVLELRSQSFPRALSLGSFYLCHIQVRRGHRLQQHQDKEQVICTVPMAEERFKQKQSQSVQKEAHPKERCSQKLFSYSYKSQVRNIRRKEIYTSLNPTLDCPGTILIQSLLLGISRG